MRKTALILFVSVLSVAAMAQKPAKKAVAMHCAVETGNKVDITKATKNHMYADYKGRRYFFCCNGCPQMFAKNPAKYAKHAQSIPIPKTAKKG